MLTTDSILLRQLFLIVFCCARLYSQDIASKPLPQERIPISPVVRSQQATGSAIRGLARWWNSPSKIAEWWRGQESTVASASKQEWHEDWQIEPYEKPEELLLGYPREVLYPEVDLASKSLIKKIRKGPLLITLPEEDLEIIERPQLIIHDPKERASLLQGQFYSYGPGSSELLKSFGEFAENTAVHTVKQRSFNVKLNPPVRKLFRYIPVNLKQPNTKGFIAFIHGTFAHGGSAFQSETHVDFNAFLEFVKSYSEEQGISVDVISWSWSGFNNAADREQAGKNLADLLNAIHINYSSTMLCAHSHGCNIINIASHFLNPSVFIDRALYLACPVRGGKLYTPTAHIRNLYNFYSPADKVQWAGSWDDTKSTFGLLNSETYASSARVFNAHRSDMNVVNILIKSNGRSQGHSSMRLLLLGLPLLLRKITTDFKGVHYLIASTINENNQIKEVLVAIDPALEEFKDVGDQKQKQKILDLSDAAQAAYKDRLGHDINYVTWQDYLFAGK